MKYVKSITLFVFVGVLQFTALSQNQNVLRLLAQRQYRDALETLRPQLSSRASRESLNLATRACLGLRIADSAYMFAQRSIEEKENSESLMLLTMAAREAGKKDVALDAARKLVKNDSKNPKAMAEAGATAAYADSLYLATKWLIAARELNPSEPTVHEYLGDVYFKQTVWELAKGEYLDALRFDSLNTAPHWKLARIAIKQRQPNDALAEYRKIYQLDSSEVEALLEIANLYNIVGKHQSAAPFYLKYLEKVPTNVKARIATAKSLNALKSYIQEIEILQPLEKEQPPNVEALRMIADAYFRMNQFENAAPYFEKVAASGQGTSDDFKQLGIAYARQKKNQEAITSLLKAIELDSLNHDAHYELGLVYYKNGDFENALRHYRRKAQLDSGSVSAILNVGFTEFQLKKYDSAAITFTQIIKSKPDNLAGFFWLGRTYAQLDSLDAEEEAYKKVIELSSKDTVRFKKERAESFYSLAYVKAKQNKFGEAVDFMKLCIQLDDTPDNWLLLGQIYAQANKRKEAMDACKKGLKLDPKHPGLLKLLKALEQSAQPQVPK